jgi:hypothetical protein
MQEIGPSQQVVSIDGGDQEENAPARARLSIRWLLWSLGRPYRLSSDVTAMRVLSFRETGCRLVIYPCDDRLPGTTRAFLHKEWLLTPACQAGSPVRSEISFLFECHLRFLTKGSP